MAKEEGKAAALVARKKFPQLARNSPLDPLIASFLAGLIPPGRVMLCGEPDDIAPIASLDLPDVEWVTPEPRGGEAASVVGAERSLPFKDAAFNAVIAVNLSRTSTTGLQATLAELWRVSASMVVHLETQGSARLLETAWGGIQPLPVQRWPDIGCTEFLAVAHARSSALNVNHAVLRLEQLLHEERSRVAGMHAELAQLERQLSEARERVASVENSQSFRLALRVMDLPGARVASKAVDLAARARTEMAQRGFSWPRTNDENDPPRRTAVPNLPFDGLATRGTPNDPELFLRQRPRVVVLCHPEWRGIRAATYGQAAHVLEVPGILSKTHARRLALFLKDAGAERVVMNGYPSGTERLARALADLAPEIHFFCVFHGTPALHEHEVFGKLVGLAEQKLVRKLGFVKHGLAEYFRQRGLPAEYVMNICKMPSLPPAPVPDSGQLQVGVFAPNIVHKNVETQVIGALMVPGTMVHTLEPIHAEYLRADQHRFTQHGLLPHNEFVRLLGTMHATCYVSLVECYPMTVLESIFSGAVCLTSNTSQIFAFDDELHDAFVVEHHDSPAAIARKLSIALDRRAELIPRAQAYLGGLNERAARRWHEFLEE